MKGLENWGNYESSDKIQTRVTMTLPQSGITMTKKTELLLGCLHLKSYIRVLEVKNR